MGINEDFATGVHADPEFRAEQRELGDWIDVCALSDTLNFIMIIQL